MADNNPLQKKSKKKRRKRNKKTMQTESMMNNIQDEMVPVSDKSTEVF